MGFHLPLRRVQESLKLCSGVIDRWSSTRFPGNKKIIASKTARLRKLQEEEGIDNVAKLKSLQEELGLLLEREDT